MTVPDDQKLARKGRVVAVVIATTAVLWLVLQGLNSHFNWPVRFAFLFDMAAIAAFLWSLYVAYQIWRDRRQNQG